MYYAFVVFRGSGVSLFRQLAVMMRTQEEAALSELEAANASPVPHTQCVLSYVRVRV